LNRKNESNLNRVGDNPWHNRERYGAGPACKPPDIDRTGGELRARMCGRSGKAQAARSAPAEAVASSRISEFCIELAPRGWKMI
jgi:hypothetical protein